MLSSVPFPACYPLSPNSASILGFRKLLLHRRKLGEIVREHAVNSERMGIPVLRDKSYQNTKAYDALRKRFRSIFTWPAFLATFIPKYSDKNSRYLKKQSDHNAHSTHDQQRNSQQFTNSRIPNTPSCSASPFSSNNNNNNNNHISVRTDPSTSVICSTPQQTGDVITHCSEQPHENQCENNKTHRRKRKGGQSVTITDPVNKRKRTHHLHASSSQAIFERMRLEMQQQQQQQQQQQLQQQQQHQQPQLQQQQLQQQQRHSSHTGQGYSSSTVSSARKKPGSVEQIYIPPSVVKSERSDDRTNEILEDRDSSVHVIS